MFKSINYTLLAHNISISSISVFLLLLYDKVSKIFRFFALKTQIDLKECEGLRYWIRIIATIQAKKKPYFMLQ